MRLDDLAGRLGCALEGDGAIEVTRVAGIEEAGPEDVTFVANPRYARFLATTRAAAVIVAPDTPAGGRAVLRAKNPYLAFARAIAAFHTEPDLPEGVHHLACVDPSAVLGEDCRVGPFAVIGAGSVVGAGARIHPHVVIYPGCEIGPGFVAHAHAVVRERTRIGASVTLQPGVVIGGDGFGFVPNEKGALEKIVQAGHVVLHDDVEVQANATIDRGTIGATEVGAGTKIDNLVQLAHGVRTGKHCLIASQTGVAGSTVLGDRVTLAGQVGVIGHLKLGDRVIVAANSGIHQDLPDGAAVGGGMVALELPLWRRVQAVYRRLPELQKEVRAHARDLAALAALVGGASEPAGRAPTGSAAAGSAAAAEAEQPAS